MKKGILYLLLASYSMLMLKPVMPYISDSIAHVFYYAEHMATVHYVDGEFHVHNDIVNASKDNTSDKNPVTDKKDQPQTEHIPALFKRASLKKNLTCEYAILPASPLLNCGRPTDYPPPKG